MEAKGSLSGEAIQKFQELLKKLFQFESSDLDFGIYRILNYKRDRIKKFIDEDLRNKVETAFAKHKDEKLSNISEKFEEIKKELLETAQKLGKEPLTSSGELKDEFKDSELGRKYLLIKAQKEEAEKIDEIKNQVFNDLYNFFSRYYEEGDFVPQYRYSIKGHKYAIPYNGEEVKLYWANQDQYYIKTGLLFRDYTFKAGDYKVIFRIVSAKEELGSNKATKERFFILDDENPITFENKTIFIRFQYRELTEEEVKIYDVESGSNTSKQEKINQKSYDEILKGIKDITLKAILSKDYKNEKPLLLYQINRFTAKNTKDYFIHKNLKKFLSEQLDYFIKSEVLDIQTLIEGSSAEHITRAKVVKEIGEDIINFLSQIEDFQKRLWEKKKFVIKTEYVITTDRVPEEFYEDIYKNEEQRKEWEDLGFEIPKSKDELKNKRLPIDTKYFSVEFKEKLLEKLTEYVITTDRVPEEFYQEIWSNEDQRKEWKKLGFEIPETKEELKNRKLPINTKYFSVEFKEKLLEKLTKKADLDDLLDGLLIKSENWQALNLILNKYKEKVQTIYIDPPYNTGSDGFLYRDRYQHSSWLTMMENRLSLAKELMKENGVIFVSIANNANVYKESYKLGLIMDNLFEKRFSDLIWKRRSASGSYVITDITEIHEYILCYGRKNSSILMNIMNQKKIKEYINQDNKGIFKWHDLIIHQYTKEQRPNLFYGVVYNFVEDRLDFEKTEENLNPREEIVIYPSIDGKSVWTMTKDSMKEVYKRGVIGVIKEKNNYKIKIKKYLYDPNGIIIGDPLKSILDDNELPWEIGGTSQATKELKELLGISFDTAKPVNLIKLLLYVSSLKNDIILDFFAGSGTTAHAVMKLNKEDGGKRKFILVEMADYFDTVIIPRLKKVAYSFNWKEGKPQDTDGIGIFFKYQILEQYEDTLDNIELKENKQMEELFKDEYLLKYFLDYETKESPYLLNIEHLKNPFSYKLKVNLQEVGEPQEMVVDIPETFNYLLGIKIKKVKTKGDKNNNGKKYLFILGEKEYKNIAIVWREYSDDWKEEDFKKDKEFIIKELENWNPHIVYINGQSVLTPQNWEVRYIEPEFKRLMES